MKPTTNTPPPDSPLMNLVINILLPVLILNKGAKYVDPRYVLLVALALPLGYGLQDYVRRGHKNYVSLIGLVNICLTGSLAVLSLRGIWFAFKEASLPFVLGLMVLGSAWTKSPAARMMFCNPQVLDLARINERLVALARVADFEGLLKRTTLWLSVSFFISSALNFVLAVDIFKEIDPTLQSIRQDEILNEQIARMTWMGFVVIAGPLMVFSSALIYAFLRRVSQLTEIPIGELMNTQKP